ncbi:ATP-dependent DNA helicase [Pelomicrobium methylotrophicum]|uniref:ATP-dependent DNA helicase n=1 Tax=Pelomicrobium methylotrophicum TaxID=2602750 RepID=A0A5C7EI79_9PROT|nr:ATP-dependent DNA helicase [Pelomicrobium methylotrophicum]TXF11725.1 ATP-dependent DNA helicase [Pelomicrobium methylotrophicum]
MLDLERVFADDGPLARCVPHFRARPQQLAMARAIARAIEERRVLVAEAGTGTGKTFAYLVPALASGGKVIISTGTKTLQDQLYHRDLPTVRAALRIPVTVALLKGRANYVCHHHLQRALADGRFASREVVAHLERVRQFAAVSDTGDCARLPDVPEDSPVWPAVTSTRDNCLGAECRYFDECFVMRARRQALAADVVVVNHHLFFADLMLRDVGVAELLPACNTVIFDEAHQLPETATLFFGESVGTGQLVELARDARAEGAAAARDFQALPEAAQALDKAARDLRLAVGEAPGRWVAGQAMAHAGFAAALDALEQALGRLAVLLETQAGRAEGLANCHARAVQLSERLARWRSAEDDGSVRWVEASAQALHLHRTPLSVATIFSRQLAGPPRAWIFTSATLSVGGRFDHYCRSLGLDGAATACWESPFDYPNHALLYVPDELPEPAHPEHTERVVQAALPVLKASQGRAFLLFTTLKAMQRAHGLLKAALAKEGLDYPVLLQGEGSRSAMLERFRSLDHAILLGSQSFWEGVDVPGDQLSVVVIDKLPFAPPDDPVFSARLEQLRAKGGNPFNDYQLPEAVITLKQGAGRLIRSESDRGVLMICDPRLATRPYGRRIVASLPPMRRTRKLEEVLAFFAGGLQASGACSSPSTNHCTAQKTQSGF